MIAESGSRSTELPQKEFSIVDGLLCQRIVVIQHNPEPGKAVGLHEKWEPVTLDGMCVNDNGWCYV